MTMTDHTIKGFILLSCALSCVTALDCLFCNGAERTASCTTRRCPKSEVGCYMQIDTLNNRDAIYARCISDHTCTHYGEWRGLGNWRGTFRTNGCCRSDNCNAPLVLNALNIGHHTCYVCEGESDIKDCKASQPCPAGQDSCFMQVNRDVNGKTTLYARCTANTTCPAKNNAWTRVSHFATDVCEACCEGNDCNKDMCNGSPPTPKPTVQGGLVAPYRLTSGIECSTCSGGDCGLTSNDAVVQCPDAFPYCMNTVENDANGNKMMTKRCASVSDCETLWWKDSSSNNICSVFDPANIYTTAFTCSYCCLTRQCNRDVHPHPDTMFIGKLK